MKVLLAKIIPYDQEAAKVEAENQGRVRRPGFMPRVIAHARAWAEASLFTPSLEEQLVGAEVALRDDGVADEEIDAVSGEVLPTYGLRWETFDRQKHPWVSVNFVTSLSLFELWWSPFGVQYVYGQIRKANHPVFDSVVAHFLEEWCQEHRYLGATSSTGRRLPGTRQPENYILRFVETPAGIEYWRTGVLREVLSR